MTITSLRARLSTGLLALPLLCGTALSADGVTIAELAPKDSVLVLGVDDSKAMYEAADRAGFVDLWEEPRVQSWLEKVSADTVASLTESLEKLGLSKEDLKRPTGAAGLAAWFTSFEAPENLDEPSLPGVVALAEYGEEAGPFHDKIVEAMEKAQEQKLITLKEREHAGVSVYTYSFVESEADAAMRTRAKELQEKIEKFHNDPDENAPNPFDDFTDEDWEALGADAGGPGYKEMSYARVDGVLLLCSEADQMDRSIDRVKGGKLDSIESDAAFNQARGKLGKAQGYAVMLPSPGKRWLEAQLKAAPEMEAAFSMTMLEPLGIGTISSISSGITLDAEDALYRQTYFVLTDKKDGLLGLVDAPTMAFTPPAFIPADAASVTVFQMNFGGILPLVAKIAQSLPEDVRPMVEGQMMMASQIVAPVLANLGPEVWISQWFSKPFSPTGTSQLFAIKARDAAALGQSISGIMGMMQMAPRDFQGNQIWTPPAGAMPVDTELAIGLGAGYLFVGPTPAVENALRQAGGENAGLAAEPAFKKALGLVSGQGIAYTYSNTAAMVDYYDWYSKNIDKVVDSMVKAEFGDEVPADEDEAGWRKERAEEIKESMSFFTGGMPIDLIKKYMGDSVGEVRSTPDGFEASFNLLRPDAD
jgi:hypothetical protein